MWNEDGKRATTINKHRRSFLIVLVYVAEYWILFRSLFGSLL